MLPKSLHTVRILTAVARAMFAGHPPAQAVLRAAVVIGYDDVSADDPLIIKAAAALARPVQS